MCVLVVSRGRCSGGQPAAAGRCFPTECWHQALFHCSPAHACTRTRPLSLPQALNMLDHEEEIYARPPRTWFQTEKEKKELALLSKAAADGACVCRVRACALRVPLCASFPWGAVLGAGRGGHPDPLRRRCCCDGCSPKSFSLSKPIT